MNDSEIIKALECCSSFDVLKGCEDCPLKNEKEDCRDILDFKTLDLINRQQAEIDRLNIDLKAMRGAAKREFAESLKRKSELVAPSVWAIPYRAVAVADIDKLVEEMGCNDG